MIVLLLCFIMKLIEISTNKMDNNANNKQKPNKKKLRKKTCKKKNGNKMSEIGIGGGGKILALSPASDCNSNHQISTNSCFSSTQEADFIQDNSDYQWFLDYNYRDSSIPHHTSILSLTENYNENDIIYGSDARYYDALAKNMDANLAEIDMESFKTEDIHALLTNLPTMCSDPLSQETISRHGESFASVSGSLLAKFDLEGSLSPRSNSQCDEGDSNVSMSICKSELLFSPIKEQASDVKIDGAGGSYSVDSLDCYEFMSEKDILLTCQANKENYTIAFEGSLTMCSENSEPYESDKSNNSRSTTSPCCKGLKVFKNSKYPLAHSASESLTTWGNLTKKNRKNLLTKSPFGNNNSDEVNNEFLHADNVLKSQSLPNLCKRKKDNINNNAKNQNIPMISITSQNKLVKLFNIQHQIHSNSSGSVKSIFSDMATSTDGIISSGEQTSHKQIPNLNLVKLFMRQKSGSMEGILLDNQLSMTKNTLLEDHINVENSNQVERDKGEHFDDSLLVCQKADAGTSTENEDFLKYELTEEQIKSSLSNLESKDSDLINHVYNVPKKKCEETRIKKTSVEVPVHLVNKSMQTSHYLHTNMKSVPYKLNCNNGNEALKVVDPSFLPKLKMDSQNNKPVYILYPNYVLPDLNFLQGKENITKVLLMPHKNPKINKNNTKPPFNFDDVEALKKKGFSHIKDWDSLNFLLPDEFKLLLADIPEVASKINKSNQILSNKKPSFCYSSPFNFKKTRPLSCDSVNLKNQSCSLERTSSTSSVTTQPSSGYRGSSTILTDSQTSPAANSKNSNPLFVYRYDSVTSSEASVMASDRNKIITSTACIQNETVNSRISNPKGILRRNLETIKSRKLNDPRKRFSMFETTKELTSNVNVEKRFSLQNNSIFARNKRISETEDEGVDAGTSSSSLDESQCKRQSSSFKFKSELPLNNISCEELDQLYEYLRISGMSPDADELEEQEIMQLRSHVAKFLALKINQRSRGNLDGKKIVSFAENKETKPPNNSPCVSALMLQLNNQGKVSSCVDSETNRFETKSKEKTTCDLDRTRCLVASVADAVEKLIAHFSPASNQEELNALGDSSLYPACAKLLLTTLCPALYAILSDGLKASLETTFGPIYNSVWQVVEVSSHQGPLTKALNDLVMRINTEETITEGLVKFNAFIFGLLNVRSLDAWFSYLRTRESVLKKHYEHESLLVQAYIGSSNVRELIDSLVTTLEPLALLPFRLDLFFEHRQLLESLKKMDSYQLPLSPTNFKIKSPTSKTSSKLWNFSKHSNNSNSGSEELSGATVVHKSNVEDVVVDSLRKNVKIKNVERPKSCVESNVSKQPYFTLGDNNVNKKRWSGISPTSKLYEVYERLAKEENDEYPDSLETMVNQNNLKMVENEDPESLESNLSADSKPINEKRFKKLQKKWEMLSGNESTSNKTSPPLSPTHGVSKIPRLITSPSMPTGIPVAINTTAKYNKTIGRKATTPPETTASKYQGTVRGLSNNFYVSSGKNASISSRTSRVDQLGSAQESHKNVSRPTSLPYQSGNYRNGNKSSLPPRRAVSSSIGRKINSPKTQIPKNVKTLSHKLPSESGHLSYNTGDKLKVLLQVDQKWLLCSNGSQKGLVPKMDVIADIEHF